VSTANLGDRNKAILMMMQLVLLAAFPMVCLAFNVPPHRLPIKTSATPKDQAGESLSPRTFHGVSGTIATASTAIVSTVLGWSLSSQITHAAPLVLPESSKCLSTSTLVIAKGAYSAEAGYDDFSGGLTLPKYNVDNEGQLGLGGAGNKVQSVDPDKLEQAQARAKAAAQKKAEAAAKKKELKAQQKAEAEERAREKEELAALKRQKQLENMNEQQRAKIEAYEAKKTANEEKQPSAIDNMKRMYGL